MERKFCHACGEKVVAGGCFCPSCGAEIPQDVIYIIGKQPVPGRGMGIASLVLGIIGILFAVAFFEVALLFDFNPIVGIEGWQDVFETLVTLLFFGTDSILALIFGHAAAKKGRGIGVAGRVLGIIGVACYAVTFIMAL